MKILLKKDKLINNVLTKSGEVVDVHEIFSKPWIASGDAVKFISKEKKAKAED